MRILAIIGALAIIVGVGAAVFFFGGFYSVAGTQEEPGIVAAALIHVRQASIDRQGLQRTGLRQLSRRTGRALGEILRGSASRAA
jgi:hypothetical protein